MAASRVVRFSVDGATKETYESIRIQADFEQVMSNIALAVRVRRQLPREKRPVW